MQSVVIIAATVADVAGERDGVRQVIAAEETTDETEINGQHVGLSIAR
jgi:hypothetical protein